ncbi:Uncharacterised protein [Vibrio cholerae]|nr:Uncharacterised protein [Vibrio cholerae]
MTHHRSHGAPSTERQSNLLSLPHQGMALNIVSYVFGQPNHIRHVVAFKADQKLFTAPTHTARQWR